jgi:hypothetical protein
MLTLTLLCSGRVTCRDCLSALLSQDFVVKGEERECGVVTVPVPLLLNDGTSKVHCISLDLVGLCLQPPGVLHPVHTLGVKISNSRSKDATCCLLTLTDPSSLGCHV